MPICQQCEKRWSWFQTIKTMFRLQCPHCYSKQYESTTSKKRNSVFILIPLVIFPINIWLDYSIDVAIIGAIIIVVLAIASFPFLLDLSNEEEPFI